MHVCSIPNLCYIQTWHYSATQSIFGWHYSAISGTMIAHPCMLTHFDVTNIACDISARTCYGRRSLIFCDTTSLSFLVRFPCMVWHWLSFFGPEILHSLALFGHFRFTLHQALVGLWLMFIPLTTKSNKTKRPLAVSCTRPTGLEP